MTREESEELIERIPYINTNALKISNDAIRLDMYQSISEGAEPVDWIMVIKDEYLRSHDEKARKHPYEEERKIAAMVKGKLHNLLAEALKIDLDDVEEYINKCISESW